MDISKLSRGPMVSEWAGPDAVAQLIIEVIARAAGENMPIEDRAG